MEPEQKTLLCRIAAAAALLVLLFFLAPEGIAALPLFALPYLLLGWDVLREAGKGLLRREAFDENFLMALATLGAMALGNYWEAAAVLLLYRIGELFEDCAVGKSRSSIRALLDIRPDTAALEAPDGTLRTVHPAEVAVGSVIVVRPGERIPLDGVVVSGEGLLDTSALTGESLPRSVGVGDRAASGCISLDGLLRLRTDCTFGASTASRILALAEQSGERKSRCERFLTRFARRYTPAVCLAALLLALLPPCIRTLLGLAGEWRVWLYRALTFLVISCPCALVIGIPLAFFAAIGGASRAGILIKSSDSLEALARVDQVAFDKTGTLTSGVLTVGELFPAQPDFPLLHVAAAAEQYAAHPIARSLCAAAEKPLPQAEGVQEIAGCGVLARVGGLSVAVGNAKLMAREGVPLPASLPDGAVVFVAAGGVYRGAIRLCDTLKPTARDAVAALRRVGVSRCVLLTGDTQRAAEETARQTGCDAAYASLLPEDKVACVEAMLSACGARRTLAFVGDGINDSPVLARADVGVAMGALGSDAAVESADVVLMDDDPRKVALALRHARRCMKIVTENIIFSIAVKVICLTLGALGLVGMGAAVFADVGTMVLAVCNAMRALRPERREKDVR